MISSFSLSRENARYGRYHLIRRGKKELAPRRPRVTQNGLARAAAGRIPEQWVRQRSLVGRNQCRHDRLPAAPWCV